jgi:hypothetical protein
VTLDDFILGVACACLGVIFAMTMTRKPRWADELSKKR